MKKLVNFLISILINTLVLYPCQCTDKDPDFINLPNDIIRSICELVSVDRNTFALVSQKWYKKAITLTSCISSPKSNRYYYIAALVNGLPIRIPRIFPNLIRLNLTNHTKMTKDIIDDIKALNLKILTATYCGQLSNETVKELTTLETLKLTFNLQLTDEALAPLVNLKRLKLCQQKNIKGTFLQSLKNLTRVHLDGAYAITVSAISGITKLEKLSLKDDYTVVYEDEDLEKASNCDGSGSYSKNLLYLNKFGLHIQPNITLVDLAILPNLEHLTLQGDVVISEQAMNLFDGKLGDEDFIKKGFRPAKNHH
jgi:hypothetical protein